ncbi:hypothetical protein TNCV_3924171 [Trichonephila clavipes]|nr:hypothetical protein TNCV_3924171 [Trichonephila clavipes]
MLFSRLAQQNSVELKSKSVSTFHTTGQPLEVSEAKLEYIRLMFDGHGSQVVIAMDSLLECHEFMPNTSEESQCERLMHVKSVEAQCPLIGMVWKF